MTSTECNIERDLALGMLRDMVFLRRFEQACAEAYAEQKIRGSFRLYFGDEAVCTVVIRALTDDDSVVATYREHGHALLRGIPAAAVMAEMFGRSNGCCGGRGGSMHLFDARRKFYSGCASGGGGLPLAVGLALADKMRGRSAVTACFFCDAATAGAEFHEALHLAALWKLPVLFVCENNLYATGSRVPRHVATLDVRAESLAHGIAAEWADGVDVLAVHSAARRAADAVRSGAVPHILELRTCRFRAHSLPGHENGAAKGGVARRRVRDPIRLFTAKLRDIGMLDEAALLRVEDSVAAEIAAAAAAADAAPLESPDSLEPLGDAVYPESVP